MKFQQLKSTVIKEGAILFAVVAMLGGAVFFALSTAGAAAEKKKKLQQEVNTADATIRSTEAAYEQATDELELFQEVDKQLESGAIAIDVDVLKNVLVELRERYRLVGLNLKLVPPKPLTGSPELAADVADTVYAQVELELSAISDSHIYSFVNALKERLGGILHFSQFDVTREKAFTNEQLYLISKGAAPEMVKGIISFDWIGMTPPVKADEPAQEVS